jgi:Cu+-exporting ATPase
MESRNSSQKSDCGAHTHDEASSDQRAEYLVKDPVCGMDVDPHAAKHTAAHEGHPYYFCSSGCRTKFVANPIKYLDKSAADDHAVPAGTIYTCPMHPQIRQIGPGACPICGMALEPETVSLDSGPNPELADMSRRFWVGLALAIPVLILEMGGHFAGLHTLIQLAAAYSGNARCAVGWMAVLRTRLGFAALPQSQHVHTHRDGNRGCLDL